MRDTRKLPRLDFAASPLQYRVAAKREIPRSKTSIDLAPRLELSLSCEAEPEVPEQDFN
jgi:hypothetical protein